MVMSSLLNLLRNTIKFRIDGNIGNRVPRASYNIAIARDRRNVENRQTHDCLAALATVSDVVLARICIDMIYRDLYRH